MDYIVDSMNSDLKVLNFVNKYFSLYWMSHITKVWQMLDVCIDTCKGNICNQKLIQWLYK